MLLSTDRVQLSPDYVQCARQQVTQGVLSAAANSAVIRSRELLPVRLLRCTGQRGSPRVPPQALNSIFKLQQTINISSILYT